MPRRSRVSKSSPFKMFNANQLENHWFWRVVLMYPIPIWYPNCGGEDRITCRFCQNSKYFLSIPSSALFFFSMPHSSLYFTQHIVIGQCVATNIDNVNIVKESRAPIVINWKIQIFFFLQFWLFFQFYLFFDKNSYWFPLETHIIFQYMIRWDEGFHNQSKFVMRKFKWCSCHIPFVFVCVILHAKSFYWEFLLFNFFSFDYFDFTLNSTILTREIMKNCVLSSDWIVFTNLVFLHLKMHQID